jgi:hypothetical protein
LNSYPPIGARAQYGGDTNDGVTFVLPFHRSEAVDRVAEALDRAGYVLDSAAVHGGALRTIPFRLQADTMLRVFAQVTSLEPSAVGSSVVLTAVFSTSRRGDLPVIQKAGQVNPLYARLEALAKSIPREP